MTEVLTTMLRLAGIGLLILAFLHIPIGKHLNWREEITRLSPVNASIFQVHTFFICLILLLMGLPCLLEPRIFLENTRAGLWLAWSFSAFWAVRLYFQWFVYQADLWHGKKLETTVHWCFTFIWGGLSGLFAACGAWQNGWLR